MVKLVRALRRLLTALPEDQPADPHEKGERSFWILSLLLTLCAFVAAAGAFVASTLQAYFAQQQLSEQRDESRPWLKVTAAIGSDFFYMPIFGSEVTINLTLLNVGKTPAFNVTLSALAEPETFFNDDEPLKVLALCNEKLPYFPFNTLVFFPDDPLTLPEPVFVQNDPYLDYRGGIKPTSGSAVIYIYGCVQYTYGNPPTPHHSGFIYLLGKPDPTGGINLGSLPVYAPSRQTVQKDGLELSPYQGEGALIN